MHSRFLAILIVLTALRFACGGCTYMPSPTEKSVTRNNIAGVYQYEYEGSTTTITLNSDGTFSIVGSQKFTGEGRWFIDGGDLVFIYEGKQTETRPGWYVVDSSDKFVILGGEGDPDAWYYLEDLTP